MNRQQAKELVEKYNNGTASADERNLVESWFLHLKTTESSHGLSEEIIDRNTDEVWSALKEHLPRRRRTLWPRIAAVAAIITVIFGASLWYFGTGNKVGQNQLVNDIAPGKNGATLTLANGKKIYINDALIGNIADESGVKISKGKDGQIIYEVTAVDNGILAYNTLTTTRGEQSQVRLPDGTLVFLNSETSLRYPTSFANSEKRMVSLEGEGFFDVTSDKKHPFVVKTNGQEVEVLGTQFNINSYKNKSIRTTLLEGSVKIKSKSVSKILKPDQQAVVSENGISVTDVEAAFSVDWKEGFFMFDNETLESITNRVARWYNITVIFEDDSLRQKKLSGTVSKFKNISEVLKALSQGNFADFELSNGILTIKKRPTD